MKKNPTISAVGIIAEYNPFHNGHAYHIQQAKTLTGANFAVIVMSGDFVQRGEPAIFNKYLRTRMALSCGADLVLELPSVFAVSSAEDFAACGISLLHHLGMVDSVCFGSESGDLSLLHMAADLLLEEPERYTCLLKECLKQGLPFPKARMEAVRSCLSESSNFSDIFSGTPSDGFQNQLEESLSTPNNILGIEYLKALSRFHSPMRPVTIPRKGQGYHSTDLTAPMASASAIRTAYRQAISTDTIPDDLIRSHVPEEIFSLYQHSRPLFPEHFSSLLNYALMNQLQISSESLADFMDWNPEMTSRISTALLSWGTWEERAFQLKTKNITYTRASRALLHLLLHHKKENIQEFRQLGYAPYARILGFRKEAAPLLTALKAHSQIPVITKTADASLILSPEAYQMFSCDLYSSHLYQSIYYQQYGERLKNEYTQPIGIL